ncbi:MAG TPA: YebC/PmpR family DNA-binding transcriptional regulator, partial [Bdellovibrionota bacterium]|nr:YebC/PmpR family DNA-binding transcriptional regulator [Bdellovibrionota bacterium]
MSGHSKWSSIKRKKGAADAKRGKVFSKLIKEISVAARMGGGDPNGNPRLRRVVDEARNINMPLDNITRAIKRGTGEIEGVSYEEMVYEGYGPGGVAILIEILTDNKNRTAAEIRKIFQKRSGNLGSAGCVAWMFERKGVIVVTKNAAPSERVMDLAIEAGAEDIEEDDNSLTIKTDQKTFDAVKKGLDDQKIRYD